MDEKVTGCRIRFGMGGKECRVRDGKDIIYENPVLYPIISRLYYPTGQGITPHFDGDRYRYLQRIIVLSPKNEIRGENNKIL
jgi:hypothetical protein